MSTVPSHGTSKSSSRADGPSRVWYLLVTLLHCRVLTSALPFVPSFFLSFAFFLFAPVGNVPFDATEDMLVEIFKEVGPVVNFRLIFDHSGKPKGIGYLEYQDAETAMSAVRNLNNVEVNGRLLRLDISDADRDTREGPPQSGGGGVGAGGGGGGGIGGARGGGAGGQPLPPPPQSGGPGPYGGGAGGPPLHTLPPPLQQPIVNKPPEVIMAEIATALQALTPVQVHELLVQLKGMALNEPEKARALLVNNPQFAFAVVESLALMGIVRQDMINVQKNLILSCTPSDHVFRRAFCREQDPCLAHRRWGAPLRRKCKCAQDHRPICRRSARPLAATTMGVAVTITVEVHTEET